MAALPHELLVKTAGPPIEAAEDLPMPADARAGACRKSGAPAAGERLMEQECGGARLPWAHLRLPPFPQIALRVLQLAHAEEVGLPRLCELVASDPAFASEVLTVANSILYAPRYPSTSLLQAMTVLGAHTLQGLCITVGVRAYLGKTMHQPAMRSLWRHNLACALIAERLAALGIIDRNFAYTAGILHDIGRTGLAVLQPQAYAALLDAYRGPALGILDAERELFGLDHCETGLQLAADWNLPPEFEPILFDHHAERRGDGAWNPAELLKVACRMADAAGYPAFAGCKATSYSELLAELPARERRLFFADVDALAAELTQRIETIEAG